MTKAEALALFETRWWESKSPAEIATFQLNEERLCMPWSEFQGAVGKALGRPVWTHEFADPKSLRDELNGGKPAPSMADILNMIPEAKRLVVVTP